MIRIFPNHEAMSKAAAEFLVEAANASVQNSGQWVSALAGGHTPRRTYELLASSLFREQMPWKECYVFWGDERCVPEEDSRSNAGEARRIWLNHVLIPPDHIYAVPYDGGASAAARRYEEMLMRFFEESMPRFDLILLGLGSDGHTASLFPGSPALDETSRWVTPVSDEAHDLPRVTLTIPVINQAKKILFLVSGQSKAHALRIILQSRRPSEDLPAQSIKPVQGALFWFVDEAAAEEFMNSKKKRVKT